MYNDFNCYTTSTLIMTEGESETIHLPLIINDTRVSNVQSFNSK